MSVLRRSAWPTFLFTTSALLAFSQPTKVLVPDNNYYKCVQFIDPSFSVSTDTVELKQILFKKHSLTNAMAEEARAAGLDTLPEVKRELNAILEFATNTYLAQVYSNRSDQSTLAITSEEVKAFYNSHIDMFSTAGSVSYIKIQLSVPNLENRARSILNEYQKNLPTSWEQIRKLDESGLLLSSDFDIPLNNEQPYTQQLNGSKKGDIIGPFEHGGLTMLLLNLEIEPSVIKPFSEVSSICENWAIAEKQSLLRSELEKKAALDFPIQLRK